MWRDEDGGVSGGAAEETDAEEREREGGREGEVERRRG